MALMDGSCLKLMEPPGDILICLVVMVFFPCVIVDYWSSASTFHFLFLSNSMMSGKFKNKVDVEKALT